MNKKREQRHQIKGIIQKDDKLYIPIADVIKFCKRFPKITSEEVALLIEDAVNKLQKDKKTMEQVPKVHINKGWFHWLDS